MESDLPWVPGAVKSRLLDDAQFLAALGDPERIYTRAPSDVTRPYLLIRLPTPLGDMGGGGYKPIVQLDAYRAEPGDEDPEIVVWRIAHSVARALRGAKNVPFESLHWSARVLDLGPLPAETSRGDASPLYRAMCRAELTIHNR